MKKIKKKKIKFGDYVTIEGKRYGVSNEHYTYKVVGTLKSNTYVDVPVQSPAEETTRGGLVEVVACICCGIQETEVLKFRLKDVKYSHSENDVTKIHNQTRKEVIEVSKKYYEMKEVVIKGQRFLQDAKGKKIPFGHPYPDTKEKYVLQSLKKL